MNSKNMGVLGIVGSIASGLVLAFGIYKYNDARSMYKAASWFGSNPSSDLWQGYMENYKICIIVGAIILIISLILLISGIISNSNDKTSSTVVLESNSPEAEGKKTSQKIIELKEMFNAGLITEEEFEEKRKDFLDKM